MPQYDSASCWEANAESWTRQSRAGYDIYRDTLNTPSFLALLPEVDGLEGLDIGCGEGTNTRQLARLGARMHAVDIAPTFIRRAKETEELDPAGIIYTQGDALALPFPDASFDFAAAFMSVMDTADPGLALAEAARILRPGGFFQFSILHPCFAPPHRKVLRNNAGEAYAIEVAEYFSSGPHFETWWFTRTSEEERAVTEPFRVPYVHLTLPQWLDAVHDAGLRLRRLAEPSATEAQAAAVPDIADTRIAPLFLHFLTEKPG